MRVVPIVQARMTSTRLPGKVLERIGDRTGLAQVLARCDRIEGAERPCCAVPEGEVHDAVAAEAERCGARVVRGDEHDVLDRYRKAAEACDADVVLRVTSDCPLIDPAICGGVLAFVVAGTADYAANNLTPSWPHGYDCEAFSRTVLEDAAQLATEAYDREHVTPWMRANPALRKANLPGPGGRAAEYRVTLDFPEDLAFLQAVFDAWPEPGGPPSHIELLSLLGERPDLVSINAAHKLKSRPAALSEPQ